MKNIEKNTYTVLFIYILFITLSVYNGTNQVLRPTELFIPFLILVVISKINTIKRVLTIGFLLLFYLVSVDTFNNGFSPMTLNRSRIWGYAIVFFALAKIFVSIDFSKYKKTINKAMIISIILIFLIYFLLYLANPIAIKYFSPESIMNTGTIDSFRETNRLLGVSPIILIFFLILIYVNYTRINRIVIYLFFINIFMFFFLQSRTFLFTFLIVFLILYGSRRLWYVLLVSSSVLFASLQTLVYILIHSEKFHVYGEKISELLYVFSSPSMFVRLNDTSYFVSDWLSNWSTFLFGRGLSFFLSYPRFGVDFNPLTGDLEIISSYEVWQLRHNADNLLSIIVVEGGIFLLLFVIGLFFFMFRKIYRKDKKLAMVFFFMFLTYTLSTVHLLTNYVLVFTMAYIYYGRNKVRKFN